MLRAWLTRHRVDLAVLALALGYRLLLTVLFFGWEESDYGNLAMARGVLDSGFTEFDMRHLPLYYATSAAVLALVGDTILATHLVSILSGTLAVWIVFRIGLLLFDLPVALAAAALLTFQPEFALYASSSLREPFYCCLVVAGLWAGLKGRVGWAALFTSGAFLTRFDAMFTAMPALASHLLGRPSRWRSWLPLLARGLAIFAVAIAAWSIYCGRVHGDYVFFRSTVQVNVETGGAQEITTRAEFFRHGAEIVAALVIHTLPRHLSWPVVLGVALAAPALWARRRTAGVRTLTVYLAITVAFWLATAFAAQHEPDHNLYWKWMYTFISLWCLVAALGWRSWLQRLEPRLALGVGAAAAVWTGVSWAQETHFQLSESARLYKPQVELAQWVEEHAPPGTALIFDNIPACYLDRRHHPYKLLSWFDIELPEGDPEALAALIRRERIEYVLWFAEDWTVAPRLAPYLAEATAHRVGEFTLTPLFSEPGYGWIFYRVQPSP